MRSKKRIEVSGNASDGFILDGSGSTGLLNATIADSVANNNAGVGFFVVNALGGQALATLVVADSQAVNNKSISTSTGVGASGTNATLFVGRTTISGNATAWFASTSAVVKSYGDNYVNGNPSGEVAMPLVAPK